MGKRVLISVIIPTYNRVGFIVDALKSVLDNFDDIEVIVVDDGSTDNTRNTVLSFYDKRIRYIYQVNKGVSAARNRGISEARGEFLAFLDSDDYWLKGKLEKQINLLKETKTLWSHTDEIWIRNGLKINKHKKHEKKEGRIYVDSLPMCIVSPSSVVIHKSIFEKVGLFDESLMVAEDYDMWLRISSIYDISLVKENLTVKRGGHRGQLSNSLAIDMYRVRALKKAIRYENLSAYERDLTLFYLVKKAEILKNGFYKHDKAIVAEYYEGFIKKYKSMYISKINFL
ncbi:MAG TPA: glycosyltransferase [Spirochaetota bacterium]|nr:glycosyltransferase [Spirochaetota bacterium]HOM38275.1 glycosyltransferase [Spirochaetota bacterium]HPQ48507.1 glycosyltransferase [Spirochaetota bacterium]